MRAAVLLLVLVAAAWLAADAPVVPKHEAAYSTAEALLRDILVELRGLRADVQAVAGVKGGATGDRVGVLRLRCASCHGADVAEEKGAGFVLLEKDGKPAELSVAEQRRVKREVERGRMPPAPATLTEAEKKLLTGK